jgi:hypothetical protein
MGKKNYNRVPALTVRPTPVAYAEWQKAAEIRGFPTIHAWIRAMLNQAALHINTKAEGSTLRGSTEGRVVRKGFDQREV